MFSSILRSVKTDKKKFKGEVFIMSFVILFVTFFLINEYFLVPEVLKGLTSCSNGSIKIFWITLLSSIFGAYIISTRNVFDNKYRYPPVGVYFMVLFFLHGNFIIVLCKT